MSIGAAPAPARMRKELRRCDRAAPVQLAANGERTNSARRVSAAPAPSTSFAQRSSEFARQAPPSSLPWLPEPRLHGPSRLWTASSCTSSATARGTITPQHATAAAPHTRTRLCSMPGEHPPRGAQLAVPKRPGRKGTHRGGAETRAASFVADASKASVCERAVSDSLARPPCVPRPRDPALLPARVGKPTMPQHRRREWDSVATPAHPAARRGVAPAPLRWEEDTRRGVSARRAVAGSRARLPAA